MRRQDDILYDLPVPTSLPEAKRNSSSGNNYSNGDIYNRMYADRGKCNVEVNIGYVLDHPINMYCLLKSPEGSPHVCRD